MGGGSLQSLSSSVQTAMPDSRMVVVLKCRRCIGEIECTLGHLKSTRHCGVRAAVSRSTLATALCGGQRKFFGSVGAG